MLIHCLGRAKCTPPPSSCTHTHIHTHTHTHTLLSYPITPSLHSLPPTSYLKRDPEIAQEAIREKIQPEEEEAAGVYSPKPFEGTLQHLLLSLLFSLFPLSSILLPRSPCHSFVLMNQCFSEHAHYGLIAGARSVSLALVANGEERRR